MKIDNILLDKLTAQAKESPRLRMLVIVLALLLASPVSIIHAQTSEYRKSYLTPAMLMKISSYCQYNQNAQYLFARANDINYRDELDRTLRTLYDHLDCAERFMIEIYDQYGQRMGYFALKDMGFTLYEYSIVEAVWKKEEERREAIAERKRREKEQALLKRINENEIFSFDALSGGPSADIDALDMATYDVVNDREELIDYRYDCIVTKEGKLKLVNQSDTLQYSALQKFIYYYITESSAGAFKPGYITINGEPIPVDCYFTVKFKEIRHRIQGVLTTTIRKDKKKGCWIFAEDGSGNLNYFVEKSSEAIKYDLETAINTSPVLSALKGKKTITANVYQRELSSNIASTINLSYYFDMTYRKDKVWDVEPIPIKYPVAF